MIKYLLIFLFSFSVNASLKLNKVGVSVSLVSPKAIDNTLGLGLEAFLGRYYFKKIHWSVSMENWKENTALIEFSDFVTSLNGRYQFNKMTKYQLKPYVGAGLAAHILGAEYLVKNESVSDSELKLGMDLFSGSTYQLFKNFEIAAELRQRWVADINQFSIRLSVFYLIP